MVWSRPSSVPYPNVWHRFQGRKPLADGRIPNFIVQDAPPEMFSQVVDFMSNTFILNEPTCKSINMNSDTESVNSFKKMWENCLNDKLGLVCLIEDEVVAPGKKRTLVGANICSIATKENKNVEYEVKGELFKPVFGAIMEAINAVNVFEIYGVDEYLTAYGLSVAKEFQGQNIGAEILKSRIPLCKAMGLTVTGTLFTAIESQVLAKKCGFQDVFEISYKELAEKYYEGFGNMNTASSKYMVLSIS